MKTVILAGGYGTRLSEETHLRPKPMVEIGGKPILWHIMKVYSHHGINEFIICLGYKGYVIKEYFANYFLHLSDVTIDVAANTLEVHQKRAEPWKITLVDTGEDTMTGGRLKRVAEYLDDEDFCFTYGDGVSDVNITELIEFHRSGQQLATVTAVRPPGRYGAIKIGEADTVMGFAEKPRGDGGFINGGFFVLSPKVIDYIEGDSTSWEGSTLEKIASEGKLRAFSHDGFWAAMDTLRDKKQLELQFSNGNAPWVIWS
ncbi:Glucose-1-phosphate cytidylyltransferase [Roseibium album]|nr:Glucose-1-phosphate cytidylyltransferase [Roseibium album]